MFGDLVTDIVEGDSILVDQVSYQEDLVPLTSDKKCVVNFIFDVIHVW
jgi:hypothetical protein